MDYYKSLSDLKRHFIKFMLKVPSFGKTFICIDDKNTRDICKSSKIKIYLPMDIAINQILKLKIAHFKKINLFLTLKCVFQTKIKLF